MAGDSSDAISRRGFGKTSAGMLLAAGVTGGPRADAVATTVRPRKYAIVGVGHRSYVYQKALQKTYADHLQLVAADDVNIGRLNVAADFARTAGREPPRTYLARDFDKMIAETKPEVVIVTTVDGFHHEYICRAMTLGCDVLTEKPMTIDAEKSQSVLDARRSTGRRLRVAFNYRYTPVRTQVKELLMSGVIGDVLSVDFDWMSYSLNAFTGWEGYVIAFNGTKGRLEHKMEEAVVLGADVKTPSGSTIKGDGTYIRIYPQRKPAYQVPPRASEGGHGGGDDVMLADLFAPDGPADPCLRAADERSGAYSILTGIAANHCFVSGQTTKIADLVGNIGRPDYPPMPGSAAALGMPPKV